MVVLMSVFLMVVSLERMASPLLDATKASVAAASFFAVIDAPQQEKGSLKAPDVTADGDIVFEGVTFAYPGRPNTKVLDDLSLTVDAGKITAIVGPSGSGKSTIVGLVEQWYTLHSQAAIRMAIQKTTTKKKKKKEKKPKKPAATPQDGVRPSFWARLTGQKRQAGESEDLEEEQDTEGTPDELESGEPVELRGRIMTSEHNLDEIDVKWWRSQIGLVQQEPFLFNDSIYTNVMHGLVGTQWEDEPLEFKQQLARDACKEAFADEFIDKLPEGYETQVGDSGLKLSGGQRQRLAIARSIVKKPKILILDEATSAIDVRSEKIIQAALDRVSQGRTTIMIAHRLSTIAKADKIIVLQKGRLMEQGTHESLLGNEQGVYFGLVKAQRLALGKEELEDSHSSASETVEREEDDDMHARLSLERSASQSVVSGEGMDNTWKNRGIIGSFGRLLHEQRSRFPFYIAIIASAAGVGSVMPLQAWLFAQVINVFTLPADKFLDRAAFWSLMWFMLAIGAGIFYLFLGFFCVNLQYFICATYRELYFSALLRQKIKFYDDESHSVGTLTSMVQGDPKQLEELLGMNMGMVLSSAFQLIGALAISYAFGWKLAIVAMAVTIPIGLVCAWYRMRYEMEFVKMSAAVSPNCHTGDLAPCPLPLLFPPGHHDIPS